MGRVFANTAWLLGGKGFGALCGLAYLAILTRSLAVIALGGALYAFVGLGAEGTPGPPAISP